MNRMYLALVSMDIANQESTDGELQAVSSGRGIPSYQSLCS